LDFLFENKPSGNPGPNIFGKLSPKTFQFLSFDSECSKKQSNNIALAVAWSSGIVSACHQGDWS
jgi:hypothetical protein